MRVRWHDEEWYPVLGVGDVDDPDAYGVEADVPADLVVAYRAAVAAMRTAEADLMAVIGGPTTADG